MRDPFEDLLESFRPGIGKILDELQAKKPKVKREKLEGEAKLLWEERFRPQGKDNAQG